MPGTDAIASNAGRNPDGILLAVAGNADEVSQGPTSGTGGSTGGGDAAGGGSGTGGDASAPLAPGSAVIGSNRPVLMRQVPFAEATQVAKAGNTVGFDASLSLASVGACPDLLCMSRGTAQVREGGGDAYTSWGRWTSGRIVLSAADATRHLTLSANHGVHYLVGVPSSTVPTHGTFAYELIGSTRPTLSTGVVSPGTFTATAGVAFGPGQPARVGLDGVVSIGSGSYAFSTKGGAANPALSALVTGADHAFAGSAQALQSGKGPLACGAGGCPVDLRGGLFGPDAARLGLSYEIQGPAVGSTISGAGVFAQKSATP